MGNYTIACPGRLLSLVALAVALGLPGLAQPTGAEFVADGFVHPLGITTDAQDRIWVAQSGTGFDDSRISVVLPSGQTFPFLVDFPSGATPEGVRGISDIVFVGEDLWFTASVSHTESSLRRISTSGWVPGDAPRTSADVTATVDVDALVFGQGLTDTNPHGIAVGPDGALYFADAGANVLLRYDIPGAALTIHTTFPLSPNASQAVPTGVVAANGRLYVAQLTGFPFSEGVARVFAVELDGSFTVHREGFTALVDIARDPRGAGALTVLEHGRFQLSPPPPQWLPGTGRAVRLDDDRELAAAFDFATATAYDADGLLYITTLGGSLYRVTSPPVASEPPPTADALVLHPPSPNPTSGPTTLRFHLPRPTSTRLGIYDVLGRETAVVADAQRAAGDHADPFDASTLAGGVYVLRLTTRDGTRTQPFVVVR
jgi:hypothetical protein